MREAFRKYYLNHRVFVKDVSMREFGIGSYGKKIVKRHISFSSINELNSFLVSEAPLFISCSAARYKEPSARPMEAKGLIDAELIYEFDVSDFGLPCSLEHDFWICKNCGASGRGIVSKCLHCGSSVEVFKFPCEKCLEKAKEETLKLIKILRDDFGIEKISVNFSGNAGYHIHVLDESFSKLPQDARLELIGYITLSDFSLEDNFSFASNITFTPKKGAFERVLSELKKIIASDSLEEYCISLSSIHKKACKKLIERIEKNKEFLLERLSAGIIPLFSSESVAHAFWQNLISDAVAKAAIKIDTQTSVDIYKIVRVPDTLHGSTGLLAKTVPLERLKEFDPLKDAVVFSEKPIKVFINKAPKFKLADNTFGPYENEEVELPMYAAIYLIGKKVAKLSE